MSKILIHANVDNNCLLTALADKYGTDKGMSKNNRDSGNSRWNWEAHYYTEVYSLLFDQIRNNISNVFEVGIGTNNTDVESSMGENGVPGASLRMWREYFPKAKIFGADIDDRILFEEDRIKTFYVDQTNPDTIKSMWSKIRNKFDIIIDDGLHTFEANVCFFENSIHKLSKNGFYIIEDASRHKQEMSDYLSQNGFDFYAFEFLDIPSGWGYPVMFVIRNNIDGFQFGAKNV